MTWRHLISIRIFVRILSYVGRAWFFPIFHVYIHTYLNKIIFLVASLNDQCIKFTREVVMNQSGKEGGSIAVCLRA